MAFSFSSIDLKYALLSTSEALTAAIESFAQRLPFCIQISTLTPMHLTAEESPIAFRLACK